MSVAVQRAVNASAYFDSCVHCGLCADACLFYTETGDPQYTPIYKLEPMKKVWKQHYTFWGRLLKAVGLYRSLTEEDLQRWEPLLYDSCTMCGRCSMVCPVGNDITYMIRKAREAMVASGFAPEDLKQTTLRAIRLGSPMGITVDAFRKQIFKAEKACGLKINLDAEGVDYLAMLSANEIMAYPEVIQAMAVRPASAGLSAATFMKPPTAACKSAPATWNDSC